MATNDNKAPWRYEDMVSRDIEGGDTIAYIRPHGEKRHRDRDCKHIRNRRAYVVRVEDAQSRGRCKDCY